MKKLLFFLIFLAIIMLTCFGIFIIRKEAIVPDTFNVAEEFKINKVIYYSSANAVSNTTSFQNPEWNLNVYQFTDIAIYLDRIDPSTELKYQNYITNISLENFETSSSLNSKIYYLNPKEIGNSELNPDDLIDSKLEYTVINSDNQDDMQNYNIPIFFQDCSTPITLRIVTELSNNYQVPNDQTLIYNGSLIREIGLGIDNLNKDISFDITIDTRGVEHNKKIRLEIPYEEGEKSIVYGDIKIKKEENIQF